MSHVLQRGVNRVPPRAVSASGLMIRTADGHEVIDGFGGAAVACLGYGNARVKAAIVDQLDRIAYAHTSVFTTTPAEELADLLVGHAPGGLTHALFLSGGAETMEAALKLTRQYFLEIGQPERTRFIARRQGFHGNTLGALSSSSNPRMTAVFEPLMSTAFSHVSTPFAYHHRRDGETEADYAHRLIDELEAEFQAQGPGTVAAFVAETVVGSTTGSVTAPTGYFAGVKEVCHRHGALLILDEVMCGMGRTGTLNAWEQEGVSPDIQMNSKGLGGGYQPIAAIQIHGRIVDGLKAGSGVLLHGHTYSGHPVACAAALAVQRIVREEDLLANVRRMGTHLFDRLHDRFGNHAHVGDIRGRGLFASIEFVEDRAGKTPFAPDLRLNARVKAKCLELGLDLYAVGGTLDGKTGDHVMLAPAFIVTPEEVDRIVAILGDAVDAVLVGLPR